MNVFSRKQIVLVVDDDREFLSEFGEMLNLNGYQTNMFTDGNEAIEYLKKNKPDLISIDLNMKEVSGYKLASNIKTDKDIAYIPIVVVTAFCSEKKQIELIENYGVEKCLLKSTKPELIIQEIEGLLSKNTR